jgi:hypothetical protein
MTFATTTDVLQSINPLAQTQEKKTKDLLHICCSRIPHNNKQTIHQQRCFSSGGGKKEKLQPKKKKNTKTKTAIFLLHQSIKEVSNQNHKNKKKESRTPKHITLNNPRLEIHKPQFKETTTTTTAKLADTNQEKSFQDTNPKGKTTKNTTTM